MNKEEKERLFATPVAEFFTLNCLVDAGEREKALYQGFCDAKAERLAKLVFYPWVHVFPQG